MHEPNKHEIMRFLVVMSLGMVASMSGQYMNVCQFLFEEKYEWVDQPVIDRNLALMNTLPSCGTIFGSILAGYFM